MLARRVKKLLSILVLATAALASAPPIEVPLEHRLYDFADRMGIRAPDLPLFRQSRPYSYADAAQFIRAIETRVEEHQLSLSPGEAHDLEALQMELGLDPAVEEVHALDLRDGEDRMILDIYASEKLLSAGKEARDALELTPSTTSVGGFLRATLAGRVGIAANVHNTRLQGSPGRYGFIAKNGPPKTQAGEEGQFEDAADGYASLHTPIADILVGKSPLAWGPGRSGGLLLGRDAYAFDQIRLTRAFGPLRFVALHGWLRGEAEPRYIAAHRVEARIHPRLTLGGGEAATYGQAHPRIGDRERGMQLQYLLPLFPIHVAEHYLGDIDNNMMSVDFHAVPVNGWALWGELLIDDFNSSRSWDHFGNKLGYLAGTRVVLGSSGVSAGLEYVRLDPWVYTHRIEGNSYTHFDRSLGHRLLPNSDLLTGDLRWRPRGDLSLQCSWSFSRYSVGHTANNDGGYFVPDTERPDPENRNAPKRAFTGILQKNRELRAGAEWEPWHECFLEAGVRHLSIQNLQYLAGNDLDDLQFELGVRLEY